MVIRDSIVVCACLSIAAHAAVAIGAIGLGGPRIGSAAAVAGSARQPPLQVRMAMAAPPPTAAPVAADAPQAAAVPTPTPARPVRVRNRPQPPAPAPVASAETVVAEAQTAAKELASAGEPGSDDYVPRRYLTQAPVPNGAVLLPYPPDGPLNGRFVAVLALYIDESGTVRRVRVEEGDPLPRSFEAAAEAAFRSARFAPGSVDGRIVKSLIRVEVTFESSDNTPPAPVRKGVIGGNPG